MQQHVNVEYKNEYRLELIDGNTNEGRQTVVCHNVVTNNIYSRILKGQNMHLNGLGVGTGVGTPSPTDTALFTQKAFVTTNPSWSRSFPTATATMVATIGAGSATGVLTEVGLFMADAYSSNPLLASHAMFADAEGNPITINKASTDILKITVKIYVTLNLQEGAQENLSIFTVKDSTNHFYSMLTDLLADTNSTDAYIPWRVLLRPLSAVTPVDKAPVIGRFTDTNGGVYFTVNADTHVATTGTMSLSTGGGNTSDNAAYEIRGLWLDKIGAFNITPEMFPARPIGKYQVGVGDGANKAFDIKTPSAVAGTQQLYVDGVLKTEGVDYTFHPRNDKTSYQYYLSANPQYANAIYDYKNEGFMNPFFPTVRNDRKTCYVSSSRPIVYDFLTPTKVNCMYAGPGIVDELYGGWVDKVALEYSLDNTTWVRVLVVGAAHVNQFVQFTEVTARYWRWKGLDTQQRRLNPPGNLYTELSQFSELLTPSIYFGHYTPSIVFTTPPGVNAIIEIDYNIQYPIKNNKYSIGFRYGCTLTR